MKGVNFSYIVDEYACISFSKVILIDPNLNKTSCDDQPRYGKAIRVVTMLLLRNNSRNVFNKEHEQFEEWFHFNSAISNIV